MLKKILFGFAMATTLVACTDDYTDWAAPQANPQEEAKTVMFEAVGVAPIDLAQVTGDRVTILSATSQAEEGADISYKAVISDEAKTQSVELAVDADGTVSKSELADIVTAFYGRRPEARVLTAIVYAYMNIDGQVVKKQASSTVGITVVPEAPVIENAYYLLGDGVGWDYAGAMAHPFHHSGADVYDDPIFTINVAAPVNEDGSRKDFYFKVAPASALATGDVTWDVVLGSDVEDGDTRPIAGLQANGGAFRQLAEDYAKLYKITLNMLDYTMTVEPLSFEEWIYMPGNPQGWNPETAPGLQGPNFDGVYTGYGYLNGEFKFTKERNWNAEYNYDSFSSYSEGFTTGGGSNINFVGEAGYYKIKADVASGVLEAVKTTWGLIGPAQPGGWDTDTDMEYDAAEDCWKVTVDLAADELKFRANDGWDINFGGDINNLNEGGNNIRIDEAGTYEVKLYLSCSHGATTRYATFTKK